MSELRKIPNVGKATEKDLIAMGYTTIESLKGKTAEQADWCAYTFLIYSLLCPWSFPEQ